MKILVLSDSHSGLSFMRYCIKKVRPDAVIHLGDFFDDGDTLAEEYPNLIFHQVLGNCDEFRNPPCKPTMLAYPVCGVKLFMTHGHIHRVKSGLWALLRDAREKGAQAALYGHTHVADCHREEDGMWVLNPGACGSFSGSAGIIETQDHQIVGCRIVRYADLEEMV